VAPVPRHLLSYVVAATISGWTSFVVRFARFPISWRRGGISDWGNTHLTIVPYAAGLLATALFTGLAVRSIPSNDNRFDLHRRLLRANSVLLVGVLLTPPVVWGHAVGLLHLAISSTLFATQLVLGLLLYAMVRDNRIGIGAFALQVIGCLITLLSLRHVFEALLVGQLMAQCGFGLLLIVGSWRLAAELSGDRRSDSRQTPGGVLPGRAT